MKFTSSNVFSALMNVGTAIILAILWSAGWTWLVFTIAAIVIMALFSLKVLLDKLPPIVDGKISQHIDLHDKENPIGDILRMFEKANHTEDSLKFDLIAFLICIVLLFAFATGSVVLLGLQLVCLYLTYSSGLIVNEYCEVFRANGGLEKSFTSTAKAPAEQEAAVPTIDENAPGFEAAADDAEENGKKIPEVGDVSVAYDEVKSEAVEKPKEGA